MNRLNKDINQNIGKKVEKWIFLPILVSQKWKMLCDECYKVEGNSNNFTKQTRVKHFLWTLSPLGQWK